MALTRQAFAAANTEAFAEAMKTALENAGLFDSVTRSTLVVTATKDGQDILIVDTGTWNHVVIFKNTDGTILNDVTLDQQTSTLASYASIATDGHFVYFILTNSFTGSHDATRAATFCVFGTQGGNVCMAHTKAYNATNVMYPPGYAWISNSASVATDPQTGAPLGGGTAFFIPRSFNWGGVSAYPLTTLTPDGAVDVANDVYGIICAPTLFTIARSISGVTPPIIEIDGKLYLTDGILLMEIR